jgi:VanZ family protein
MPAIPHLDKLIHATMMGGMVGAIAFDYKRADRSRMLTFRFMALLAVSICLFGALDEIAQVTLTTNRSGDWFDLLADIVGAWAAVILAPPAINAVLKSTT